MKYPGFEDLMEYENDNTRDKIINAAIYVFASKGYVQATTKGIASLAGVSEALVFKYYGNKQKLLERVSMEILSRRIPDMFHFRLDEILNEKEIFDVDLFSKGIKEKFAYISKRIGYFKIIFLELSNNSDDTIKVVQKTLNEFLAHLEVKIIELQKQGAFKDDFQPRTILRSFIGNLNLLIIDKQILKSDLDIEKELDAHIKMFMNGVGKHD